MARAWRRPLIGELTMGLTTRAGMKRSLPSEVVDSLWPDFDHGTQRAILKLYRSTPESLLPGGGRQARRAALPGARAVARARPLRPTSRFGRAYADALGGEVTLELVDAGHWAWLERPELIDRVAEFLG